VPLRPRSCSCACAHVQSAGGIRQHLQEVILRPCRSGRLEARCSSSLLPFASIIWDRIPPLPSLSSRPSRLCALCPLRFGLGSLSFSRLRCLLPFELPVSNPTYFDPLPSRLDFLALDPHLLAVVSRLAASGSPLFRRAASKSSSARGACWAERPTSFQSVRRRRHRGASIGVSRMNARPWSPYDRSRPAADGSESAGSLEADFALSDVRVVRSTRDPAVSSNR